MLTDRFIPENTNFHWTKDEHIALIESNIQCFQVHEEMNYWFKFYAQQKKRTRLF